MGVLFRKMRMVSWLSNISWSHGEEKKGRRPLIGKELVLQIWSI